MRSLIKSLVCCTAAAATLAASAVSSAEPAGVENHTIGFALTNALWALYQTADGKTECPTGFNEGPREQFKALFPNGGSVEKTQLAYESMVRYPLDKEVTFPYQMVSGKTALGLNLDDKVKPDDFTTPDGVPGVDNQLYRAIGCTRLFRSPDGTYAHFTDMWVREMNFNRILFEVTNVDNLTNDDSVDVSMYRGLDRLLTDATGANIVPGGSNRIDDRFGARFIRHFKGKIQNGVLITEPVDVEWPWAVFLGRPGTYIIKGMRLNVKLNAKGADGFVGGYADVNSWYEQLVRSWSTHHSSYGGLSQPSLYPVLQKLADGYPDSNGKMTAISSALKVSMVQVFIQHPTTQVVAANQMPARH